MAAVISRHGGRLYLLIFICRDSMPTWQNLSPSQLLFFPHSAFRLQIPLTFPPSAFRIPNSKFSHLLNFFFPTSAFRLPNSNPSHLLNFSTFFSTFRIFSRAIVPAYRTTAGPTSEFKFFPPSVVHLLFSAIFLLTPETCLSSVAWKAKGGHLKPRFCPQF